MKIKSGFTLKQVAGSYVVMNLSKELDFNGLITLNETGAFIWVAIENGKQKSEIAEMLVNEYEIDLETALSDVNAFIDKMVEANVFE